ncbi:MAG: hypothetical protein O6850_04705 [Acidobacteria bacterium]|nr:hypothetical protein [Acidobacteriota bacterium]
MMGRGIPALGVLRGWFSPAPSRTTHSQIAGRRQEPCQPGEGAALLGREAAFEFRSLEKLATLIGGKASQAAERLDEKLSPLRRKTPPLIEEAANMPALRG